MTAMTKDEKRPVSQREGKLNVSVRPRGSVLKGGGGEDLHRFAHVCVCGVHVRFESRRQKSNYRLLLLRGTPKANVSFPRGARGSLLSYRTVYLTYQHILQTAIYRRSVFAPIRNSSRTNDDRCLSKIEDLFRITFSFYIKEI